MLYMWVSAVAFGAVSFSLIPMGYAVFFTLLALLIAFVATLVPLARGKIGPRPAAESPGADMRLE